MVVSPTVVPESNTGVPALVVMEKSVRDSEPPSSLITSLTRISSAFGLTCTVLELFDRTFSN